MALFERFHLSQEEAEARLKRALTGDPTRDITTIRTVERVMAGGVWIDVARYRKS